MQKFTHVKQLGIEEPCFKIITNRMFKDALTTQIRVNALYCLRRLPLL